MLFGEGINKKLGFWSIDSELLLRIWNGEVTSLSSIAASQSKRRVSSRYKKKIVIKNHLPNDIIWKGLLR